MWISLAGDSRAGIAPADQRAQRNRLPQPPRPAESQRPFEQGQLEMASQSTQLEDTGRLWEEVLAVVQGRIGSQQAFETWFKPIHPVRLSSREVELQVPNSFFVDWIHQHHLPGLREALSAVLGDAPEVRFITGTSPRVSETAEHQAHEHHRPTGWRRKEGRGRALDS